MILELSLDDVYKQHREDEHVRLYLIMLYLFVHNKYLGRIKVQKKDH